MRLTLEGQMARETFLGLCFSNDIDPLMFEADCCSSHTEHISSQQLRQLINQVKQGDQVTHPLYWNWLASELRVELSAQPTVTL